MSPLVWDISVAYYGNCYPHHITRDLKEIAECGFTSITLYVNELELLRHKNIKRFTILSAHDLGLRVFIDMHGFGFFVPSSFSYLVPQNPEFWQIDNRGKVRPLRGCPNNPNYKEWIKGRIYEAINKLNPDGMFWDEPCLAPSQDWPDVWTCRCKYCISKFKEEYGYTMPININEDIIEFRERSVYGFLADILSYVKEVNSQILNILCLMPEFTGRYGIRSWDYIKELSDLDVFATDPYWIWFNKPFEWFVEQARKCIEIARKARIKSQIWVELIKIPKGREEDVYKSVIKAADLGADAIATWSFRAECGSDLSAEDPDTAWQAFIRSIKKIMEVKA